MIETYLQNIASNENGRYTFEYFKVGLPIGSKGYQTNHKLQFEYNESVIEILIQIGLGDSVKIVTTIPYFTQLVDFAVECISPFENLFLRRKSRFKVKSKNKTFRYFLENKALAVFDKIMETQNFDPRIFTQNQESHRELVFEYHIAFENWIFTIEEIIKFLKIVLDELKYNKSNF
jgi:hypothetical protein